MMYMYIANMLRIGDKGELLVRTGTMTGGYHNNLTKSASAFADGWLV